MTAKRLCLSCLLSVLTSSGCADEPRECTLEQRAALSGELRDREGTLVTPDRVERIGPGSTHVECFERQGGYNCPEAGPGRAQVKVTVADKTWTQSIRVREDKNGCHDADQQLDFTLPELTPCKESDAVTGALIDGDGRPLSAATVILQRPNEDDGLPLWPPVQCAVEMGHFRCPAINYYSDATYELIFDPKTMAFSTKLQVRAADCKVETVQFDIDLRSDAITRR